MIRDDVTDLVKEFDDEVEKIYVEFADYFQEAFEKLRMAITDFLLKMYERMEKEHHERNE